MIVKVKKSFKKFRQVKKNNKSRKYILRGERNVRYHERILSNKKNIINSRQSSVQTGI